MRDILEHEKTAILFEPGDEYACRKAIETAASIDENEMQNLKNNCIELAKKFDHEAEANELFKSLCRNIQTKEFLCRKIEI